MWQFYTKEYCLNFIKSGIMALIDMMIFIVRSVIAKSPYLIDQLFVIGNNSAAISQCTQILSRIEAEACGVAKASCTVLQTVTV